MPQNIIPSGFNAGPGLLGYNPADMRRQMMSRGLMEMGLTMMGQGPSQYPVGLLSSIGQGAQAGLRAADDARGDYQQQGLLSMQMADAQRKRKEEEEQSTARNAWINTLDPEQQSLARFAPGEVAGAQASTFYQKPEKPPTSILEFERAQSDPAYGDWLTNQKKASATNVTVGDNMKLTEDQSKSLGLYSRGVYAQQELDSLDSELASFGGAAAAQAPALIEQYLKTPKYQQAERAGREFLAVILRKDSGATITDDEMDTYGDIFLPKPGEDQQTILNKREARKRALMGIQRGLGNARGLAEQIDQELAAEFKAQTEQSQGGTSEYTPEDLEFTAKKHGITVEEVKRRLGIQ